MSAAKKLIINCGAGHVTASVFSERNNSLVLESFAQQDLEYDLTEETEWLPVVMDAVRNVKGRVKGGDKATLIVPGYQLLTKLINVPHVDESKRAQIIAFEAQQKIPFPLNEVVWDHQVIADDGVETEVVVIAVKSEVINGFCTDLRKQGITPLDIEAASILDYNAYKYCYPGDEEDTLLINIGARSSNLLFINELGFFIRNITLGGNTLTQNLADSLGKNFVDAEQIKIAFFSGQTSMDQDDPSAQVLQTNAQNFQKKLSQEVTRSIVNYRRQRGAAAPKRILLTGRGSLLPGLAEQLEQSQRMPVHFFDPVASLEVGSNVDAVYLEEHQHVLSEVVGEAARMIDAEAVSINLLPQQLAEKMRFAKQKPFILIGAACLALATVPPIFGQMQAKAAYEKEARQLKTQAPPLQSLHTEIVDLQAQAESLRDDIGDLESLVNSRSNWIAFFSDLQERLQAVQDVWLEDLKLDRAASGNLDLSGRLLIKNWNPSEPTASYDQAYQRVNKLLESFKASEFISDVKDQNFDDSDPRILKFDFSLVINPERPL
ncbi:pilus assembly protein PilM [Cerasicoccus fimbriatus]|uniref:pilus assembly protein PilM n=1 Tax=Cerasicoccus fimbriatus TaxID=3014554 RepID=UPI0022B39065|nr:pilus assembly protein PilM [Cerasicoccus sp. TK19100]